MLKRRISNLHISSHGRPLEISRYCASVLFREWVHKLARFEYSLACHSPFFFLPIFTTWLCPPGMANALGWAVSFFSETSHGDPPPSPENAAKSLAASNSPNCPCVILAAKNSGAAGVVIDWNHASTSITVNIS